MKSTASALDTSAEKSAATPKVPSQRGSDSTRSAGRAASALASSGWRTAAAAPRSGGTAAENEQHGAGGGEAAAHGGLTAGPEELLQDAGGHQEGRDQQRGVAEGEGRIPEDVERALSEAAADSGHATGGGQRVGHGKPESQEQDPELHEVHRCCTLEPPHRKVGGHHHRRGEDGERQRYPRGAFDEQSGGEQLRREHEEGGDEQETGERDPDRNAVAQLEEVAHRAEPGFGGDPPHPGAQPDGEEQGADARGPHPPEGGEPVLVAERGRADGRAGTDVRGEHGRENQPRRQAASGHEEAFRGTPPPGDVPADRDQQDRIGREDEEMRGHACLTAGGQGGVSAESGSSPGGGEAPG